MTSDEQPMFEAGAFHIEAAADGAWCVYDGYVNRAYLYFATSALAIDATVALAEAAEHGVSQLEAEYARQVVIARASLEAVA